MFDLIKHLVKNDIKHTVSDNGNITVTNNLDLEDVRGVDALPDNLTVGGSLDLSPEQISNVSYRENCGYSSRTIFAMWTGKEFRIAAGCFFGSIEQFEQAVDDKYDGNAAEAYKKAGRDCVAELTEKLNPKD
ncbi:TPA: hypothetical protein J5F57_003546 [Escherichia coli]|uniref:hypothetical protein n=1 Tax=Hafnia paralvei TaxID=546367 RepID=UPI001B050861|nr:hypothetical protein [Hafnia paralvei]MBU2672592.1 hypothetical protein [Hafnia paralvei]HBA3651408.1 hypothetical protein [Escherichia coli]